MPSMPSAPVAQSAPGHRSHASPLRRFAAALLDLVLPRVCVLCEALLGDQPGMVCGGCWMNAQRLPRPHCERCGHATYFRACQWCALLPPYVVSARSVCWVPDGTGGAIVHKLKYDGWRGVAVDMADRIVRLGGGWPSRQRAILVPVPLGTARRRERGFNQSEVLARALAERWTLPLCLSAVTRTRDTDSQALLTADERSANVHGAFAAGSGADEVRGAHVVLVDDVVTTAATLNACAEAVIAAGAPTISYITFGRARAAFDRTPDPRNSRSTTRWLSASASTASAVLAAKFSAPQKSGELPTSTSSRSMI